MTIPAKDFGLLPGPDFGGVNLLLYCMYPYGHIPGYNFLPPTPSPRLIDSDLVAGPAVPTNSATIGDGLGEGAIVTVWGQGLGIAQGTSQVYFKDSAGTTHTMAHIYYWKRADGQPPGGPANTWKSHLMQEIAFSIPSAAAAGLGEIYVIVNGNQSNSLPFTVRAGNVYWVASGGSNSNSGLYASPKPYINGDISGVTPSLANGNLAAGDIVYSMGVTEPVFTSGGVDCGLFMRSLPGTQASQIAFVSYPGNPAKISCLMRGEYAYLTQGIVTSKFYVEVGNKLATDTNYTSSVPGNQTQSNVHINATKWGRAIGNYLTNLPGYVCNGWYGGFYSGADSGENYIMKFNHIEKCGGPYTSHYQHTTYMSIRDDTGTYSVTHPWTFEHNFLDDNQCMDGVHWYDQSSLAQAYRGVMTGTLKVNYNVIRQQRGAGIAISTALLSSQTGYLWAADIEIIGNVLINTGLGPKDENNSVTAQAINVGGTMNCANVTIDSNTIYAYSDTESQSVGIAAGINVSVSYLDPYLTITNNTIYANYDVYIFNTIYGNTINVGHNNAVYTTVASPTLAVPPAGFTSTVTGDIKHYLLGSAMTVDSTSPVLSAGSGKLTSTTLFGNPSTNIGAL